ncbi:anthrax toxin-like adenylyl cyclase domain-containing protein [Pseudoalteromonas luteoviolacea]|uniref:anthrax toxin-like adenylyl cyclase domain-containing protein n=1 Tax=Pseudoalteromonas luteoviolacea TaxID=43657 RepID=UPI00163BC327|nr:anthrax toxin-like adenylyl cyclase domain-containing protein [Pseudoalteromonas luteoviolacea]
MERFGVDATQSNCGILDLHIEQIKGVAAEERCFLMFRPVNLVSANLIAKGVGTKGLDIHGKSSDLGPISGFIPVKGIYSKIRTDPEKVKKHDAQNRHSLLQPHIGKVFLNKSHGIDLLNTSSRYEFKFDDKNCLLIRDTMNKGAFERVEVMGYKQIERDAQVIPVTADYDMFCVAPSYLVTRSYRDTSKEPRFKNAKEVTDQHDENEKGILTTFQMELITTINDACKKVVKNGQDVVKHGTEMNNPFPENDEQLVVFSPNGKAKLMPRKEVLYLLSRIPLIGFITYPNKTWKQRLGQESVKWTIIAQKSRLYDDEIKLNKFVKTAFDMTNEEIRKADFVKDSGATLGKTKYEIFYDMYIKKSMKQQESPLSRF